MSEELEQEVAQEESEKVEAVEIHESEEEEPSFLERDVVQTLLPEHLPKETKERILEMQFGDELEAKKTIAIELEYLKAVTNAGKPVAMSEQEAVSKVVTIEQIQESKSSENKKWLGV